MWKKPLYIKEKVWSNSVENTVFITVCGKF